MNTRKYPVGLTRPSAWTNFTQELPPTPEINPITIVTLIIMILRGIMELILPVYGKVAICRQRKLASPTAWAVQGRDRQCSVAISLDTYRRLPFFSSTSSISHWWLQGGARMERGNRALTNFFGYSSNDPLMSELRTPSAHWF